MPSYEDKKYTPSCLDAVASAFEALKYKRNSTHDWNLQTKNFTNVHVRFVHDNHIQLIHSSYEQDVLSSFKRDRTETKGKKIVNSLVKELQKAASEIAGKKIKLKKVDEQEDTQMVSRLDPTTSYVSSRFAEPMVRMMVRDIFLFKIEE